MKTGGKTPATYKIAVFEFLAFQNPERKGTKIGRTYYGLNISPNTTKTKINSIFKAIKLMK